MVVQEKVVVRQEMESKVRSFPKATSATNNKIHRRITLEKTQKGQVALKQSHRSFFHGRKSSGAQGCQSSLQQSEKGHNRCAAPRVA